MPNTKHSLTWRQSRQRDRTQHIIQTAQGITAIALFMALTYIIALFGLLIR